MENSYYYSTNDFISGYESYDTFTRPEVRLEESIKKWHCCGLVVERYPGGTIKHNIPIEKLLLLFFTVGLIIIGFSNMPNCAESPCDINLDWAARNICKWRPLSGGEGNYTCFIVEGRACPQDECPGIIGRFFIYLGFWFLGILVYAIARALAQNRGNYQQVYI